VLRKCRVEESARNGVGWRGWMRGTLFTQGLKETMVFFVVEYCSSDQRIKPSNHDVFCCRISFIKPTDKTFKP